MPAISIGLLGYGTVGSAVHRLLDESGGAIERVTGRPVEVAAALVRDPAGAPRAHPACSPPTSRASATTRRSRSWPR